MSSRMSPDGFRDDCGDPLMLIKFVLHWGGLFRYSLRTPTLKLRCITFAPRNNDLLNAVTFDVFWVLSGCAQYPKRSIERCPIAVSSCWNTFPLEGQHKAVLLLWLTAIGCSRSLDHISKGTGVPRHVVPLSALAECDPTIL